MQTAMQQLINEIVEHLTYDDDLTEDSRIALETIRLRCLGKLEMEKQQIMNTYIIADSESTQEDSEHNALKFYERTYGSKGSDDHIAERSYSEKDMRQAFIAGGNSLIEEDDDYGTEYDAYMEDWFEQFKNK